MKITIPIADDFHIHLRNDERMPIATSLLKVGGCGRGIIMPNTAPKAIETAEMWEEYKGRLQTVEPDFTFLGSIKLTPRTTHQMIIDAVAAGIPIGKQYPAGVTTNSEDGVSDISEMYPVYEYMQEEGLPLSFHGEVPKAPVLEAETLFIPMLKQISKDFPKLKMIMEHISTAGAVDTILDMPDHVVAGIALPHLTMTLDNILASNLKPHNYCMPVVKMPKDRQALIDIIKIGNPKFFFGSDSAPHFKEKKEKNHALPGIFSTPIIIQMLATLFEENDMMDKLENFTSRFGAEYYGLERNTETITLTNEIPYQVPAEYDGIISMKAGTSLPWSIINE